MLVVADRAWCVHPVDHPDGWCPAFQFARRQDRFVERKDCRLDHHRKLRGLQGGRQGRLF